MIDRIIDTTIRQTLEVPMQSVDEVAQFKHLRIDPDFANDGGPDPQEIDAPGMAALLSLGLVGLAYRRKYA